MERIARLGVKSSDVVRTAFAIVVATGAAESGYSARPLHWFTGDRGGGAGTRSPAECRPGRMPQSERREWPLGILAIGRAALLRG